jgi:hypothetical protein
MAFHCITEGHDIRDAKLLKEVDDTYKLNSWESLMLNKHKNSNLVNNIRFGNSPSILFKFCES